MGDEDDDLLRAAEELGIDLSGVRAGESSSDEAADESEDEEVEEGEEGMTADADATDAEYIEDEDAPVGEILNADEE